MNLCFLIFATLLCSMVANFAPNASVQHRQQINTLDASVSSTICYPASGDPVSGVTDCTGGEVHLLGQYINIGLHRVGSFGTSNPLDSSYYTLKLGIIADFDRNGFSAAPSPSYSGDFITTEFANIEGQANLHRNSCSSSLCHALKP